MTSSRRTAICACPNSRRLSLLPCFLTSFLLFPPAGWRGARRRFVSGPLQIDSSAAVLVFLLMAAPPATRSGPPAGGLGDLPEVSLARAVCDSQAHRAAVRGSRLHQSQREVKQRGLQSQRGKQRQHRDNDHSSESKHRFHV